MSDPVATLTPSAERALYLRDYVAWLAHAAPRIAALIPHRGDGSELATTWSMLSREEQRAVWALLNDVQRERVRAACASDHAAARPA